MGILKNRKKVNVGARIKQGMYDAGVGVAFAVVEDAIGVPTDVEKAETQEDLMSIGTLVVGIGLPILIPGTEMIANPLTTLGAYKAGKNWKIADKLGLVGEATTTTVKGLGDRYAMGNTSAMFEQKRRAEKRSGGDSTSPNPLG